MIRSLFMGVSLGISLTGLTGCNIIHSVGSNRINPNSSVSVALQVSAKNTSVHILGIRKFPYPYKAMLAISSDADHKTLRKFNLVHEFLNTSEMTPMGHGLGLDISDSFFMYNGSNIPTYVDVNDSPIRDEFTYFRGTSTLRYGGDMMDVYIHNGWMDTIHTYGDFSRMNQM